MARKCNSAKKRKLLPGKPCTDASSENFTGINSIISTQDKQNILDIFSGDNSKAARIFLNKDTLFEKSIPPSVSELKTSMLQEIGISTSDYVNVVISCLQKVDALEQELEQLQTSTNEQIAQILHSVSWRLTSPLRYLKKIFLGRKN